MTRIRESLCCDCEFKEIVDAERRQHRPMERRRRATALVVEKPRMREMEGLPLSFQRAAAMRDNVVDPLRLASISEGDHESVSGSKDEHRRAILSARFPPCVYDNAPARHPLRERTQKMIGYAEIESRQPAG